MQNDIHAVARFTRKQLFGVGNLVDDARAQWDSAIVQFQNARAQLDTSAQQLSANYALAARDPTDLEEWARLENRVTALMIAMDAVASSVSTVADWWRSATGFFNLAGMKKQGVLGALGLIPAFPITVGALLAFVSSASVLVPAVAVFVTYLVMKRDRVQQLIDAGIDPLKATEAATEEAQKTSGYTFGARLEKIVMWSALGLVAMFVLPQLLKGVRR